MASPEDAELVGRSRKGDRVAFSALYEKYRTRLFAFCFRLIGSREGAEDVVQTAFLKAYQSIASLDDPRLFYYWLFSIARNEALSQVRGKRGTEGARRAACALHEVRDLLCGGSHDLS